MKIKGTLSIFSILIIMTGLILIVPPVYGSPGKTTISTDKTDYKQWETVYLTLRATGNVDHFRVTAKENSYSSSDYIYDGNVPATFIGGSTYEGTCSFQLSHGDINVYITALAFDSDGYPGVEGEITVYSEQVIPNPFISNGDGTSNDNSFILAPTLSPIIIVVFMIFVLFIIIFIVIILYFKKKKKEQIRLIAQLRKEPVKTINERAIPKIDDKKKISKFCPQCGTKLENNPAFCSKCGYKL